MKSIGETLETLYGGKKITIFNKLGKEYPIIVQQYLLIEETRKEFQRYLCDLKLVKN